MSHQTASLNAHELKNATDPSASWHADYRDTAYIFIGSLPDSLSEGDILTIFSQYGTPTHLHLQRDKETGKSKGFAFLKYRDQRSCDLAVDNLGGTEVLGRRLRVDHSRYKRKEGEGDDVGRVDDVLDVNGNGNGKRSSENEYDDDDNADRKRTKPRKLLKPERELEQMLQLKAAEGEDEDPMRDYLIQEKREEVALARRREEKENGERKHKHHHRHRDREGEQDEGGKRRHTHRHRSEKRDSERRHRDEDREEHASSRSQRRRLERER